MTAAPRALTALLLFLVLAGASQAQPGEREREREREEGAGPSLRGTLLVATPKLAGTPFEQAVILVLNHYPHGAAGLVVNFPSDADLEEVLPGQIDGPARGFTLYLGGPVRPQRMGMLLRAKTDGDAWDQVLPKVAYTAYEEVFDAALDKIEDPNRLRVYSGLCGWAPQQLEFEIARGDWYILPGSAEAVFSEDPESLWQRLVAEIKKPAPGPQRVVPVEPEFKAI